MAMKILILTDNFLPSLGGVERHTYTLACYLSKLSHDVVVVTRSSKYICQTSQLDKYLEGVHKIKVLRILPMATSLPLYNTTKYLLFSRSIVKYFNEVADKYDIVHYHGTHQLFLRFTKCKSPIITSVHGIFPACVLQLSRPCKKRSLVNCAICDVSGKPEHVCVLPVMIPYYYCYYRLMEESLNSVKYVICVSDYVKSYIKNVLNVGNLVTIYNFIDLEEITSALKHSTNFDLRDYLNIPSSARIITYFGNLSFNKGVDLLIKAFKKLRKSARDDIYLVVGGEGPQRRQLEDLAEPIGNIIFTGFVPRKIQLAIMAQSDVFVHPARYPDACPTTILEAMALGLPVVATRLGGIPELIVDKKGGYLADPNSPDDLATKISIILNNEKFKSQVKVFNLEWVHRFDITLLGPKIIQLYEKALA
ncbi:MAG: glycosyltransferase family 4 protein [Candidatus Bathyarchaeia archaeon]